MTDVVENKIYSDTYDLFDKCLYGGLGHGVMVFPSHVFKIIFTIIFPPLGVLINTIEKDFNHSYPFITWDIIIKIFRDLNKIIYSYILTSLFYIPGLIYTLSHHSIGSSDTKSSRGIVGSIICDPESKRCYDFITEPATAAYHWSKQAGIDGYEWSKQAGEDAYHWSERQGRTVGSGAQGVGEEIGSGSQAVGEDIGSGTKKFVTGGYF